MQGIHKIQSKLLGFHTKLQELEALPVIEPVVMAEPLTKAEKKAARKAARQAEKSAKKSERQSKKVKEKIDQLLDKLLGRVQKRIDRGRFNASRDLMDLSVLGINSVNDLVARSNPVEEPSPQVPDPYYNQSVVVSEAVRSQLNPEDVSRLESVMEFYQAKKKAEVLDHQSRYKHLLEVKKFALRSLEPGTKKYQVVEQQIAAIKLKLAA